MIIDQNMARRIEAGAASQKWALDVRSESAQVALPLLYWPGWKARIIGSQESQLQTRPLDGLGYILLDLPQGKHTVGLWLGRTPLRMAIQSTLASSAAQSAGANGCLTARQN